MLTNTEKRSWLMKPLPSSTWPILGIALGALIGILAAHAYAWYRIQFGGDTDPVFLGKIQAAYVNQAVIVCVPVGSLVGGGLGWYLGKGHRESSVTKGTLP